MGDRLLDAMATAAARQYGGEPVSELAHSLQCAELAAAAGADEDLVLACLLHDVGRFAVDQSGIRDRPLSIDSIRGSVPIGDQARAHHDVGAELVEPYVSPRVSWLVRMHADAKRYLCTVEPEYRARLTPTSIYTLELQGGLMSAEEVRAVGSHPWLADALALRRWDDRAKAPDAVTRPLGAWEPLLRAHFTRPRAAA
jgi:gamma-butyrobetaine dioxygenase